MQLPLSRLMCSEQSHDQLEPALIPPSSRQALVAPGLFVPAYILCPSIRPSPVSPLPRFFLLAASSRRLRHPTNKSKLLPALEAAPSRAQCLRRHALARARPIQLGPTLLAPRTWNAADVEAEPNRTMDLQLKRQVSIYARRGYHARKGGAVLIRDVSVRASDARGGILNEDGEEWL